MAWTSAHQQLLEQFAASFPPPPYRPPDGSNNDDCRGWTRRAAEQFAFSFPGEGWGHKSAGGGRPPSTDVIATRSPFIGYDLLLAQGAPNQTLARNPGGENLAGQEYIPVTPTDHLGSGTGTTPPPVTPPPTTVTCKYQPPDLEAIRNALLSALHERDVQLRNYLDNQFAEIERRDAAHAQRMEELIDMTIKRIAAEADRIIAAQTRCRFRF